VRDRLEKLIRDALERLEQEQSLSGLSELDPGLQRARDTRYGDFASNVAMRAAKMLGRKPRELAETIISCLPTDPDVEAVEVAGPGFINIRLAASAHHNSVRSVLEQGSSFGSKPAGSGEHILLEYVSANPTGPLHVGHGRHAAYGATLANVLRAVGHSVDEEYYVNDAGRQMEILALSVWLRYAEANGASIAFPASCYQGG